MIQVLFVCVLILFVPPLYADDPNLLAFESASKLDAEAYAVARAGLESKGQAIVPLLREKSTSENWRESFLADALLFRIERPVLAAQLRWALILDQENPEVDTHGNLFRQVHPRMVAIAKTKGENLAAGKVVFSRESLPIVLDCFREFSGTNGRVDRRQLYRNTLVVVEHLNPPLAAEPLIHLLLDYHNRPPVEIFVRMGETVIPVLHNTLVEALQHARAERPNTDLARRIELRHRKRAELIVKALGEMGSQNSGALLIESLDEVQASDTTVVFCNAIAKLKATGAAETLFECLARNGSDDVARWQRLAYKDYLSVREDLLSLDDAKKVLLANSSADVPQGLRCIAGGMLYELENPERVLELKKQAPNGYLTAFRGQNPLDHCPDLEVLAPLLIELAVAADMRDLNHFNKLAGNEDVFKTLSWMLNRDNPAAILPLAKIGGARALTCYRREIEKNRINRKMVDPMIEGALMIGAASSDFLDELAQALSDDRQKESGELVSQIAQQLRRDADNLAPLLGKLKNEKYRFLVARMMAKKGDLRCLPLLMEHLQCAVDYDEDRRRGGLRNRGRRDFSQSKMSQALIVSMGEPAVAAIKTAAKNSAGKYAALFSESLILGIQNPELVRTTEDALKQHTPGFQNVAGPSRSDYEIAGKRVAEQVGGEGVPLLEANIALAIVSGGSDSSDSTVAAFALGELEQERSIAVIVDLAQISLTSHRGESLAGVILEKFGAKGVEAATKLKAADPSQGSR